MATPRLRVRKFDKYTGAQLLPTFTPAQAGYDVIKEFNPAENGSSILHPKYVDDLIDFFQMGFEYATRAFEYRPYWPKEEALASA